MRDEKAEDIKAHAQAVYQGNRWLLPTRRDRSGEVHRAFRPRVSSGAQKGVEMNVDEHRESQAEENNRFGGLLQRPDALWTAYKAFLDYKASCNRRPAYLKTLRSYLRRFIRGREADAVCSITTEVIAAWFKSRTDTPAAQCAGMGRISSFLTWAVRRKLIGSNPMRDLERPTVEHKAPRILTPGEARRLVYAAWQAKPAWVPYIVLGLYAGIRPEEMHKLTWGNIDLKRRLVTIDAAASKVRLRRLVPLHPKAVAWLERSAPGLPEDRIVLSSRTQPHTTKIAELAGLKWSHDILRHTAASYLMALHQDAGKVSRWLGNSIAILQKHYLELVTPEDSRRFWKYRLENSARPIQSAPLPAVIPPALRPVSTASLVLWLDCATGTVTG